MLRRMFGLAVVFASLCLVGAGACGSDEEATDGTSNDDDGAAGSGSGASGGNGGTDVGPGGGGSSSSSGSGGSGATGGAGCSMGLGDACSDCAAMSCNALYCACYANPACGTLIACVQMCAPGDA